MRYHSTKKWCLVGTVVGLLGCRTSLQEAEPTIQFCVLNPAASKSSGLSAGDEVAVCARLDGTETYFLQHATFTIGADGRSLTASPGVLYPQAKQAVTFYAYFPYRTGLFSVPSDQSTAAALKQADLCWATAKSTPVPTLVPLEFEHTMARLVVVANKTPTKITVPNALVGGSLDVSTGVFTATIRSQVSTTGSELIVPVQPLSRLVLTVSGIEYVFEGPINLQSGQTTTLNLTLNPSTKTATLSGSSTTAWSTDSQMGSPIVTALNTLTIHWPQCHPQSALVDKVVLTIKDHATNTNADYIVSSGIAYANQTFTVPFVSSSVRYPYTIVDIALYHANKWLHRSTNIKGGTITKREMCVLGVQQPLNPPSVSNYVLINGLKWATGNLVAKNAWQCQVGGSLDCGLYFRFGSLIGWGGGTNGDGTGNPTTSISQQPIVKPVTHTTKPVWSNLARSPGNTSFNEGYFTYNSTYNGVNYSTLGTTYASYPGMVEGDFDAKGIGDACRYYLGEPWRMPTSADYIQLFGLGNSYQGLLPIGAWNFQLNGPALLYRINPVLRFSAGGAIVSPNGSFTGNLPHTYTIMMSSTIHNYGSFEGVYASSDNLTTASLAMPGALSRDATTVRCVAN